MAMMSDVRSPQLPHSQGVRSTDISVGSHVAMIKRVCKLVLAPIAFTVVLAAIMALRYVAWLRSFHH